MAKRLLLNVLLQVLGDFVEGLTEDNLKIGVWSGEVVLENLTLSKTLLRRFNSPLALKHGFVKRMELIVPWATLESNPVKILIDGVNLILEPVDLSSLQPEAIRESMLANKFYKLNKADKAYQPNESEEASTYFQRLTAKILDNLELKLLNVHVRYEDSLSVPDRLFSVGATLEAFTIVTTDANWVESFVARGPSTKEPTSIHKLGTLQNAGVYWNVCSAPLEESAMHEGIYRSDGEPSTSAEYLLQPPSRLVVKLVHNENFDESVPKYDVSVQSNDLRLALDKAQYSQLLSLLSLFSKMERLQLIAMEKRPQRRPNQDPRGWWRYAYRLIIGSGAGFKLNAVALRRCLDSRRRYIQLLRSRRERESVDDESGLFSLSDSEQDECVFLEEELPLEALVVFRQLAKREQAQEALKDRRHSVAVANRSWWGWLAGEDISSSAVESDDVSIKALEAKLLESQDADVAAKNNYLLRFCISSSATLLLADNYAPIVYAVMTAFASTDVKSDATSAYVSIGSISLEDRFTVSPVISKLIDVHREFEATEGGQGDSAQQPSSSFEVTYVQSGNNTRIKVDALPLVFTINKSCVQRLLDFFTPPEGGGGQESGRKRSYLSTPKRRKAGNAKFRKQEDGFEFTFEADAPKIIVPEDSSVDKGYLLLDAGHLIVVGHMSFKGMVWDVVLNNVNAGMPQSAQDLYGFRQQNSYLIRPFDVSVQMQNVDKSSADMVVDVLIKPSLAGELDAPKLARLLHISRLLTATFAGRPNEAASSSVEGSSSRLLALDAEDVSRVLMLVRVKILEVALDLTYDVAANQHLVLSVKSLDVKYFNRRLDTDILIDLSSLAIQESSRIPSQRLLAWTPPNNLIKFTYTFARSFDSPVYLSHASEVKVRFENISLNIDEPTVLNLRPFILVLLGKDAYSQEALKALDTNTSTETTHYTEEGLRSGVPTGMRVVVALESITLDVLRKHPVQTAVAVDGEELGLETAFTFLVSSLTADVQLTELIKSDVKLRSLEIFDKRLSSRDYLYRTIFSIMPAELRATSDSDDNCSDWVQISYAQTSRTYSSCEILIPHLSSFLSLDAVLDLSEVAIANAFAFMALNSVPNENSGVPLATLMAAESVALSTVVRVPNPKIIFLEDPTSEVSKAIVCRCGLDVNHVREVGYVDTGIEVKESLLVSMQRLEVFTLDSLVHWEPQQILEPFDVEFNMRRRIESAIVVTCDMRLDLDSIDCKLSVRDIVLAQSILTRRSLAAVGAEEEDATDEEGSVAKGTSPGGGGVLASVTAYTLHLNAGDMHLVLINDYYGQNTPFARAVVSGLSSSVGGLLRQLGGHGSFMMRLDYYNSGLSLWEPILEHWQLSVALDSNTEEVVLAVSSLHTMQVTITGAFLEKLLQSYSLLTKLDGSNFIHESAPEISVRNLLGADMGVTLVDSLFGDKRVSVPGGIIGDPVALSFVRSGRDKAETQTSGFVNVEFEGGLKYERLPLLQLPLKPVEPRLYNLQLLPALHEVAGLYQDPLIVEYFQNERFDPLLGTWRQPFLPIDPPFESNGRGKPTNATRQTLPEGWEWLGDWIVDMRGVESGAIDSDGWEYGTSFGSLCVDRASMRRTRRQMDSVRRRKFIRFRVVRKGAESERRPLSVLWSVQQNQNGTREVTLRSCVEFVNVLPYAVMVAVSRRSASEEEPVEFGPIQVNQSFPMPLMCTNSSSARLRPVDWPHGWSDPFMCGVLPLDYVTKYAVECKCNDAAALFIEVHSFQKNKCLQLTMATYAEISNWLPCDIQYSLSADPGYVETGALQSGKTDRLAHIDVRCGVKLSIHAGSLRTQGFAVPIDCSANSDFRMILCDARGEAALNIKVETSISATRGISVIVYSPFALVDRSGLDLVVWSKAKDGVDSLRSTFASSFKEEKATNSNGPHSEPLLLRDLSVDSLHPFLCSKADIGSKIYLDRQQQWSYLPSLLRGQTAVSLCCDDALTRSKAYMQFSISKGGPIVEEVKDAGADTAVVFLLFDVRRKSLPAWVSADGFQRVPHWLCIGKLFNFKVDAEEIHFAVFAKIFSLDESVVLRGNWASRGKRASMYSVFVVPVSSNAAGMRDVLLTLQFDRYFHSDLIARSWIEGGNGLTLFTPEDDAIRMGVLRGTVFSDYVKVGERHPSAGSFEVTDWISRRAYQLSYRIERMLGAFSRTHVMHVMPRYVVVNCMDEVLEIRQHKTSGTSRVHPWSSDGWHKTDVSFDCSLQFKLGCSMWSKTTVDINEIGSSTFILPRPEGASMLAAPIVLLVEVRQAEAGEECSVLVVVQKAAINGSAVLSIRNGSDTTVTVIQAEVKIPAQEKSTFEIIVRPGMCVPFGWIDPEANSLVQVVVGDSVAAARRQFTAVVDMLKMQDSLRMADGSGRTGYLGELVLQMESIESGRVLSITKARDLRRTSDKEVQERRSFQASVFMLSLSSLSISLVIETPTRREFLSCFAEDIGGRVVLNSQLSSYEVHITDLQVDNYSESAVHPVLLYGSQKETVNRRRKSAIGSLSSVKGDVAPLFQFALVHETSKGGSSGSPHCIKYLAMRLLELSIQLDSGTIKILLSDLLGTLSFISADELLSSSSPHQWASQVNRKLLSPEGRSGRIDVYHAKVVATASKVYFENLIVHPMKLRLTFVHSPLSRDLSTNSISSAVVHVLTSLAEVDDMKIRLNSFIVSNALESATSLQNRLVAKLVQDLQLQLATIAGSLTIIGSPLGLAHKIGGGVKAFFYEPYLGAVESPQDFFIGIGIGTSSLVSGVVSGALNSTASIVDSASRGISYLSADPEYVRERVSRRQMNQASKGGIVEGFVDGSESVISGISSGVSGLFMKPVEEGAKGGVLGFMVGLGKGVVGMAVKPVLGVADGLTSVAQGISNQVSNNVAVSRVRPPRALECSDADPNVRVVKQLDLDAARAQEFIKTQAKPDNIEDAYEFYIPLGAHETLIASTVHLYWQRSSRSMFKCPWYTVSHVVFVRDKGISLVLYKSPQLESSVMIPVSSAVIALEVYAQLTKCSYLMGNAVSVLPTDVVRRPKEDIDEYTKTYCKGLNELGELDGYRFGSANTSMKRSLVVSERELLQKAALRLLQQLDWQGLDSCIWRMIAEWDGSHVGLAAAHCLAGLFINKSDNPVQLANVQMLSGVDCVVLGCPGYKHDTRVLLPGGSALLFAWGYSPTPMESGAVKVLVTTENVSVLLSSEVRLTNREVVGSHKLCFLEKSVSQWWSKYVVHVS